MARAEATPNFVSCSRTSISRAVSTTQANLALALAKLLHPVGGAPGSWAKTAGEAEHRGRTSRLLVLENDEPDFTISGSLPQEAPAFADRELFADLRRDGHLSALGDDGHVPGCFHGYMISCKYIMSNCRTGTTRNSSRTREGRGLPARARTY